MGSNLMETVPDGVRAFLFMQIADGLSLQEMWRSGGKDKGTGGDGKRVLGICGKRHRSVLIHDAEKDTQMRGIKFRSFLSALCVPIFDTHKSFLGAILLIADDAEVFTNEHKFAVERSARDYGPTLESMRKLTENAKEEEESVQATLLFSPVVLFSVAFAFMLLAIWVMAPPVKEPTPVKTMAPKPISHQALDISDQFLATLQSEDYDGAWLLLHSDLQAKWSSADFARALSNWAQEGDNKEILSQRVISKVQRHNRSAQVLLFESPVRGDQGRWNWELREDDGDWGVLSIDGPVSSPKKDSRR